jgi:type I restriction enzyme, R subunit
MVAESATLQRQAANNTKEQLANSPNLKIESQNAMTSKALNSPTVMGGLLDALLNHSGLYEKLREPRLQFL